MTSKDKGKQLAIQIENLVNDACKGIMNVKTKMISNTAMRDELCRKIGFLFQSKVHANRNAVKDNTKIADDLDRQYQEATQDFEAMSQAYVILSQRFPRKQAKTPEELHNELFGK